MARYQKLLILLVLLVLVPIATRAYETERVVLVIIDGLRYSEGLGDPNAQYVPGMAALAEQGAIVDNFHNDGFTWTSRAIPAIWCGAWTEINTFSDPDCDGSTNNTTELPTVFEYYRQQLDRPATDCVYTLKALCPWKASLDPEYGPDYWPLYHAVGSTDEDVFQETEAVITQLAPHFLLMYLADVDHAGHVGVWDDYLQAITTADSLVGRLWDVLQADTAYAGKTTMLVTNDHGRHDYDFTGHGDGCEGCRHIQLLAIGPDIQTGLVSEIARSIPDITPTIGELLGFTTEAATGTALLELLEEVVGLESSQLPQRPELKIFPNPANPMTTMTFNLSLASELELQVYDLSGRLIRTILDHYQAAGQVQITWDGNADNGQALSSGAYIIRLRTETGVRFGKVVLLR